MAAAGRFAALAALAALLVLPLARAGSAAAPVKAPRLAFYLYGSAQRHGDTLVFTTPQTPELYIRIGTRRPILLTHSYDFPTRTSVQSFALSPDGQRIAFCHTGEGDRSSVFVVDQDGSGLSRLGSGCFPVWSPDGRRIAFTHRGTDSYSVPIWVVDADGRHLRRATRPGAHGVFTHAPERTPLSWAPGRQIVFDGQRIYKLNPDTRRQVALTRPHTGWMPLWSPDGHRIAYTMTRHGDISEVHVVTSDGYDRTITTGHTDDLAIWTDSTHLVFERARTPPSARIALRWDMYVISFRRRSRPHRLTASERQRWFP